ncbi:AAA family ATPase [Aquipseudomonas guryensis]|uniref:Rad50/SbcC-type AAA domain-containing protein n=1 Tax=Aquipseudomonas guryensis TaxID=2759165 RepID=A0A7W4DC24_9GAMM|nr:AAA family ATPase [Pseudomonas guryensis]MBB1519786.1 hypothetical protein [Pseudomonas guryensis]
MIIRAIKLRINTPKGLHGFFFSFSRNLTVIKGNNSSGKSTFFNSLLYSLGMEELVGGKSERILPYAVRDYLEDPGQKLSVISSEILTEIENRKGDIVTLRRAIRDDAKDSKLVEIARGPVLTNGLPFDNPTPTYLHDPGSAQRKEGFFHFLEDFLDLNLPKVATTNGPEVKLYLQAIFAAHAVEQKRGWTDYIASIPFYGIREARTRVSEYILGLGVFEAISKRNQLNTESIAIDQEWRQVVSEIKLEASSLGFVLQDTPSQPKTDFDPEQVNLSRSIEGGSVLLPDYISNLLREHSELLIKTNDAKEPASASITKQLESAEEEVQSLSVLHERAKSNLAMQRASLIDYEELLKEAKSDLDKNKAALKLQELGASHAIQLAVGLCPTCHQGVDDTLLRESKTGPSMDLKTNIGYLESQHRMLQRQIAGLKEDISKSSTTIVGIESRLNSKRDHAVSLRGSLGSTNLQQKTILRRQVQIEIEIERLQKLEESVSNKLEPLQQIARRLELNQLARRDLPAKQYDENDESRISVFEKNFRANAGSFGYESVSNISEVKISRETLVPGLEQIELREIIRKQPKTDIKADSSASDFVRLIWSYLLALYQTSANPHTPGNHLGIILFDEPGQHSMRWESQRELLLRFAAEPTLQSIVAASFDESETVFRDVTNSVPHKLIRWEGKLIRPLTE